MFESLLNCRAKIALCVLVGSIAPGPCVAQHMTAPTSQTLSPERRAAILQELEAMKKRIDALEAELNAGNQPARVSEDAHVPPAAAPLPASEEPASVVNASSPAPASESSSLASAASHPAFPVLAPQKTPPSEPFAFADFTWMNGNPREKDTPLDTKLFTPEFRADVSYIFVFNHPKDDTLVG